MAKPTQVKWLVQIRQWHFIGENVEPMHLSQNRITAAATVSGQDGRRTPQDLRINCLRRVADLRQTKDPNSCQPLPTSKLGELAANLSQFCIGNPRWCRLNQGLLGPVTAYLHFRPNPTLDRWKNHCLCCIECRIADVVLVWVRLQLNLAAHNM